MRFAWQYRAMTWFLAFVTGSLCERGLPLPAALCALISALCIYLAYEKDAEHQ